jgi:hypothetical protein
MADGGRRADVTPARIRFTLLLGAILATLLATGCATIPSSGPVGSAPIPAPPAGGGVSGGGLIVEGPQPGWNPEQVVSGFLLASASFAHRHATAREYLTASASRLWQPGAQVTILASAPSVYQQTGRLDGQGNRATVLVSWQELATLDASGQYTARGGAARQYFVLESVHGEWRIAGVPSTDGSKVSHELLLPAALFRLDYAPRNLYFYGQLPAGQPNQLLVPAPVFVPLQSSDLVTTLVNDLLLDPSGWLENGAVTAFPPGSRLRKIQVLPGPPGDKTAIVDIGLPRGTPRSTVQAMAAQLVWTLTSPAYSAALIQAVKLKINGRLWAPRSGDTVQSLAEYGRYMPRMSRPQNLYYVSTNGAVRMFGQQAHSVAVPGQAGTGEVPLSKIAVSMNGHYLAGIAASTVYTADLAAAAKEHAPAAAGNLHSRLSGARFSTPSWDSAGDLWVAGRVKGDPGVWVIPAASEGQAGAGQPAPRRGAGHRAQGRPGRGPHRPDRRPGRQRSPDGRGDHAQRRRHLHYPGRAARSRPHGADCPDLVRRRSPVGDHPVCQRHPALGGAGQRGPAGPQEPPAGHGVDHRRRPGERPLRGGVRRPAPELGQPR